MNEREIVLVEPTLRLKTEFLALAQDFARAGDNRYQSDMENFTDYITQTVKAHRGENLAPGRVPQSEYWLVSDDYIFGCSRLRHSLNAALETEGAHIGYDIRPSERSKGYGALILKLTLEKAGNLGLARVLLTCDEDNSGSVKIIEANGGVLSGKAISEKSGKPILKYWIELG